MLVDGVQGQARAGSSRRRRTPCPYQCDLADKLGTGFHHHHNQHRECLLCAAVNNSYGPMAKERVWLGRLTGRPAIRHARPHGRGQHWEEVNPWVHSRWATVVNQGERAGDRKRGREGGMVPM